MADETIQTGNTCTTDSRVGDVAARYYNGQSFVPANSGNIQSVGCSLENYDGTPTDDVIFSIQADSSGSPSGTDIGGATATLTNPAANTTGSLTPTMTATFGSPPAVTAASTYWVVIRRSGAADGTNFRRICRDDTNPYGVNKISSDQVTWNTVVSVSLSLIITNQYTAAGGTRDARKLSLLGVG